MQSYLGCYACSLGASTAAGFANLGLWSSELISGFEKLRMVRVSYLCMPASWWRRMTPHQRTCLPAPRVEQKKCSRPQSGKYYHLPILSSSRGLISCEGSHSAGRNKLELELHRPEMPLPFANHFGRPPLIPHRFPLEYHDQ